MRCDQTIPIVVINIYSLCSNGEKFILWDEIERIMVRYKNMACCAMGDFNAIRN